MSQNEQQRNANVSANTARNLRRKRNKQTIRNSLRGIPRSNRVDNFRDIPIAQARKFQNPRLTYRPRGNQVLQLNGTDMFQLPSDEDTKLHMTFNLPCNPVYWKNTRISSIASVYQKFKPVMLRIRYVPNCPATSSGSITMGFVEQEVTFDQETAVQTILNGGGKNINIYQTDQILFRPKLKDDLFTNGDMNQPTTNPFTFYMYTVKQSDVPPGIVYLDWQYEFKLGSGNQQMAVETKDNLTPETILALQSYSVLYSNAKLKFGWGTVLGWLKTTGVKILKKVGIVVCQSVLGSLTDNFKSNSLMARTVPIREGQYLSIDPSDIYTSPSGYTRCKTSDGSDYLLPDTARVSIYMSGPNISSPGPIVGDRHLKFNAHCGIMATTKLERVNLQGKSYYSCIVVIYQELINSGGEVAQRNTKCVLTFSPEKHLVMITGLQDASASVGGDLSIQIGFELVDNGVVLPFYQLIRAGPDTGLGTGAIFADTTYEADEQLIESSMWLQASEIWQQIYDKASDKTPWQ